MRPATKPSRSVDRAPRLPDSPGATAPVTPDDSAVLDDPLLGRVATADGLFVTDENQRIATWSTSAERMLGFSGGEVVGRPCYLVINGREPDGHPVCRRSCPVTKNARRGRGTTSYEVSARTREGGTRLLWNSIVVVESPNGFRVMHLLREAPASLPSAPQPLRDGDGRRGPAFRDDRGVEKLTRRELECLRVFAQVATIEDVSGTLSISHFTARNHLANAQRKLGARNRLETVIIAARRGLI